MRLRTQWKWFSPVRVAMAFECFFITSPKGLLQMRPFQMRITASSESPSASDTIRQPEIQRPLGNTPTLSRTAIVN